MLEIHRRRALATGWLILLGASGLVTSAREAQAQLLQNGSFESPVVGGGSYAGYGTGDSSIPNWLVVGAPGNVAIVSGAFTQNGYSFPAQSGAQWLDLTGTSNSATGVQQTISTNIGSIYSVSFWVGNTVNPGGIFGTTSTVNVTKDGTQFFSATNSGGGGSTAQFWQQFTTSFVATGTTTTLAFLNGDPNNDTENGLDNVVVTGAAPTTAPEPSSIALIGTGLVGLVPMTRRRVRDNVRSA